MGGQKDKCLWLRRSLGRAGTQTQDQGVQLKTETKLPPNITLPQVPNRRLCSAYSCGTETSHREKLWPESPVPNLLRDKRAASMAHIPPPTQVAGLRSLDRSKNSAPNFCLQYLHSVKQDSSIAPLIRVVVITHSFIRSLSFQSSRISSWMVGPER